MGTKHLRRPSPATIIASIALFVSLGGTSYALAVGSIGSREIRNDSVRSVDVRDGTLRGKDVRPDALGGNQVDEATLDASKLQLPTPPATTDGTLLRALVTYQGQYANARGVEDVDHLQQGIYLVHFDRDVTACVAVATVRSEMAIGLPSAGTGEIVVRPAFQHPNAVRVHTANNDGQLADQDFTLLVAC